MRKTCEVCGRVREWRELQFIGFQEDGLGGHLELRNCACGATHLREVAGPPAADRREVAADDD